MSASCLSIDCDGGTGSQVIADPRDNPFPECLLPRGGGRHHRNGGRLEIGTVGGITSERWATSDWNRWAAYVGIRKQGVHSDDVEVWFGDEARIAQKNKITRRWAKKGSRPSAPHDQRTASAYIFGAICPADGKAAGLILPWCNIEAMDLHLAAISAKVAPGRHAALLLDQAGWHTSDRLSVPTNITIVPLPAKCPELNPQENVWEFMRDNWLSNRVFSCYDNILDHCADAWNKLEAQPWRIMTLGLRDWIHRF